MAKVFGRKRKSVSLQEIVPNLSAEKDGQEKSSPKEKEEKKDVEKEEEQQQGVKRRVEEEAGGTSRKVVRQSVSVSRFVAFVKLVLNCNNWNIDVLVGPFSSYHLGFEMRLTCTLVLIIPQK